ncbi:MAG TPA: TonB-dependent receptor [Kofleriaceae bacterium]|nr:TonB-dependent receptor [Kofleriaceae bacterium]
MRSLVLSLVALWTTQVAWADEPAATDATTTTTDSTTTTDATNADQGLSDEELQKLSEGEAIEIFDERPDKPFDRDTEVRLTGEQLAARGAVDLATALALLPDVTVQAAGRGGATVIIRGASKGQVAVLIDGILVSDPYYGTFDLTSIPVTDIVQIRMSTTPQSPIDGVGGPGGVVEVHTRDAIGPQLVIARATSDTLPTFGVSGTSRVALAKHLALRIAAAGLGGGRSLTLAAPYNSINENRRDAAGSMRLEYRKGDRRVALDGFVNDRHYMVPPSETTTALLLIDRENNARSSAKLDDAFDGYQLQAQGSFQYLRRISRSFSDPTFAFETAQEDLTAKRYQTMGLLTHAIGKDMRWAASANVEHERADVTAGSLSMPQHTRGDVTLTEIAGDLQYERKTIRIDGAGGLAIPFGIGASPWPEGKLVAKWRPRFGNLEITATGAHKGRVPSLRERFQPGVGDPSLAPEKITHAEVRAIENVENRLHVELAPFYRHQQGTIVSTTQPPNVGMLVNLGTIDLYGFDFIGRGHVHPLVELGAAYSYVKAHSSELGDDPLSHLPRHRGEASAQFGPVRRFTGLVRGIFYGQSYINQTTTLPYYATLEISATWQIDARYLAVLRGTDLTDERPLIRPGVYSPGRTITAVLQGSWD